MKSDQKKDGENDKRKHKKIENLGESSQASVVPSSNVLFNEANELQGVLSNNDSNLSLDSASQQSNTVTLQLPASSSMFLESTEAANKTLHDFALSPLVNDAIAQMETFNDSAARIQDAIKIADVTDVVYQIQNYENTIRDHMAAIKVALPEIPKLSFPTLENPLLLNEIGLSAISGSLTYKGKSLQELEKEEQETKFQEINEKIADQQKIIENALKKEHIRRTLAEEGHKNAESKLKEAEEKQKQSDERISRLEAQLSSLKKDTETINNFFKPRKGIKQKRGKLPKPQYVYRSLVMYENGKFAINGKPFHCEPVLEGILKLLISKRPGEVTTYDDIREECYEAHEWYKAKSKTISKYVSKLRKSLEVHGLKNVISNVREQGWTLEP